MNVLLVYVLDRYYIYNIYEYINMKRDERNRMIRDGAKR